MPDRRGGKNFENANSQNEKFMLLAVVAAA
jgi:hypothetical protein